MVRVLAVVPMKGHSERVPGKNLRPIAGKPLFHWILDTLLATSLVDEVMVDTDSDEIEAAVRSVYRDVSVNRRPEHLHGDLVPMHDIVAYIADHTTHPVLLQTHATNPLLTAKTIDAAIRDFGEDQGQHDSLMSVTVWQSRFFFPDGRPVNHEPAELLRTQDLPPLLEENSNIYIAPTEQVRRTRLRIGTNPILFPMDASEAIDIDDQFEFELAELLLERRDG
ncbi:MAG TPA: acylneuraminate cytidylyltransferase family protein [Acidimicrobiia bacterium]